MADDAQVTRCTWSAEARAAMQESVAASPWAGVDGFIDTLGGSHLWRLEQGAHSALLAVRLLPRERGRLLAITGFRSLGERYPAGQLLPAVERIGREVYLANMMTMCTRHPHLVRACERQGWTRAAAVVNKELRISP